MPEIVTPRLRLRPARPEDAEPMHRILSDPRAMRFWSTDPHPDLATTTEWLSSMIGRPDGADFIIEHGSEVIGKAGAWQLPEVGFILSPDHWGKGFAQEAMAAVIAHLWATTDAPRLTADVDPDNDASIRLLTKLGFHETHRAEKTFFIGGQWVGSIYLALDRPTLAPASPAQ